MGFEIKKAEFISYFQSVLICVYLWFNCFMLIHSATQLLTLKGGPQRGRDLGTLGIIQNGAVLIRDEKIVAAGSTDELLASYRDEPTLDASGCVVMPGLVDPHTHVIWAGDRADEFEMKMAGKSYLDILAAGGGIISTVRHTRTASIESLIAQTRPRLLRMFAHGTTTVEAKTGYGLQTATELRLLKALLALEDESPLDLAITFLGAHAIAPEYTWRVQVKMIRKVIPIIFAIRCFRRFKAGGKLTHRICLCLLWTCSAKIEHSI